MSSDMHIATMMAERKTREREDAKKNISFHCLSLSHVCVCMQSAVSDNEAFFSSFFLFPQDYGGISAHPGMYPGGQGQRPCEEDRYRRNVNVRLCDKRRLMWLELVPGGLCLVISHTNFQLCRECARVLSHHAVSPYFSQSFASILMPFVVSAVAVLCYDSDAASLLCVEPRHNPFPGVRGIWPL